MFKQIPILALAAVAVNASPLQRRQTSVVESAVSSAVSSAVASATSGGAISSAVSSAVGSASSVASGASSAVSSAVAAPSSLVSSAVSSAESAAPTTTGNETYEAYPCPPGFLLTYVEQNVTIPATIDAVKAAVGPWAISPIFPNVTEPMGQGIGASHMINIGGASLMEQVVNYTEGTASAIYTWNLTNGPVEAMGVSVSNYSTVLSLYDPGFDSTGVIGTNTTALTFTNFCASSQPEGMTLVMALGALELGNLQQAVAGGAAPAPAPSGPVESASSAAESATMSASSAVESATSAAASGVSSVASEASSAAGSLTTAPASISSQIASAISSAVSSSA